MIAAGRGGLTKIMEKGLAQTAGGLTVMFHGIELPEIGFFHFFQDFAGFFVFQQEALDDHILGRKQQDALGRLSVTAGSSGFLVVVFQAGRHVVVEYIADVGFVDAHAEGVGGNDHQGPVVLEILLGLLPFFLAHACMIPGCRDPFAAQAVIQIVHILSGGTVDDAAVIWMIFQEPENPGILVLGMFHPEIQIGPVEPGDQDPGMMQFQALEDVFPHLFRGGRCEGAHHRPLRKEFQEIQDPGVTGTEVLSPLRDAMGFVHGHHGDIRLFGKIPEQLSFQSLRCHIDHLIGSGTGLFQGGIEFPAGKSAVDVGRFDPSRFQCLDLILHQRDQRRDDQGDPRKEQGWDLVAERFAGPGGHDPQYIPALEQGIDQDLLSRTERSVSKILF